MVPSFNREVDLISSYGAELSDHPEDSAPPQYDPNWEPSLNEVQREVYKNEARYILAYGERGSGKSLGAAHKLVRHCWNNFNALAVVVVGVKRQATQGGIFEKIQLSLLPEWQRGVGMQFTEVKSNIEKDVFIYVSNKFGGWSKILLLSMPVGSFIKDRAKGLEMSFLLIDEIQTLASDEYFSVLIQQLGRRAHIAEVQQLVATCNPLGPSHWTYKRFFEAPVNPETGEWNPLYKTFHVPISDNLHNLPQGYYDNVMEAVKNDPIEYRRMVLGEWVDRPSGDAIFAGYFSEELHMRGDLKLGRRILPKAGFDIILGYDLGTANSAISFIQNIPTRDKDLWIVFDEMVYTDSYVPYTELVPAIMRRIKFWNETVKTTFNVIHISDATAFNMFRATTGTYDSLEVERISRDSLPAFEGVDIIKMIECPKFPGSVAGRVKTTMKFLNQERLLLSTSCERTKDMFFHLEMEKIRDGKYTPDLPFSPKRSKHLHIFDAMSYALFFYELGNIPTNSKTLTPPELMPLGTVR